MGIMILSTDEIELLDEIETDSQGRVSLGAENKNETKTILVLDDEKAKELDLQYKTNDD